MNRKAIVILLGLMLALPIQAVFPQSAKPAEASPRKQSENKYGKDSTKCMKNISLYREYFKQWKASNYQNDNLKDIMGPWRWVYNNCPLGTENTFVDGAKIYSYNIENTKDSVLRNAYIDTLMTIYDMRIKYFGKEGANLGRKGSDLYLYRPADYEQAYNIIKRSVELEGNNSAGPVLFYYLRSAITMVKNGKADSTLIMDVYNKSMGIVDQNLKKYKDSPKELGNWEVVQGNLDIALEPYVKCADLVNIYKKELTAKPGDVELLKRITGALEKKGCQSDPFYTEASKKLQELQPAPK